MAKLTRDLEAVQEKTKQIATYFCEDSSKFKLEALLMELNVFITELEEAKKVWRCIITYILGMYLWWFHVL